MARASSGRAVGRGTPKQPERPKGRAKSKGHRSTDLDWLDVEEAPRADLPDARKLARKARMWRSFVWTSVVFLPIVLVGMVGLMASDPPLESGQTTGTSSPGRAVAASVVHAWLAADPSPIPGGQVVSWDGAENIATRDVESNSTDVETYTVTTESNRFTVGVPSLPAPVPTPDAGAGTEVTGGAGDPVGSTTTAASDTEVTEPGETAEEAAVRRGTGIAEMWEKTYRVTVLVEVDSRGGVKPISQPSVVPEAQPATDGWEEAKPAWPGLIGLSTPDPVKTAVSRWSTAYISADPEELRLATGDPTATNRYFPFTGPDSITAVVLGAGTVDEGVTAVVRVRFSPHWPGQPVPEGRSRDIPVAPPFDLDVLVLNANTGSPVIVAWGPPGTGDTLVPYQNAVIGDRPEPATTTSTTATTSTTPAVPAPAPSTVPVTVPVTPAPVDPAANPNGTP